MKLKVEFIKTEKDRKGEFYAAICFLILVIVSLIARFLRQADIGAVVFGIIFIVTAIAIFIRIKKEPTPLILDNVKSYVEVS